MNNCSLQSIENIPFIIRLQHLELDDNNLQAIPEQIKNLSCLATLKLMNNQLKSSSDVAVLRDNLCLRSIDLKGNPLTQDQEYYSRVREFLPQLDLIDGRDKECKSYKSDEDDLGSSFDDINN